MHTSVLYNWWQVDHQSPWLIEKDLMLYNVVMPLYHPKYKTTSPNDEIHLLH